MLRPTLMAAALAVAFPAYADADLEALRAELQQLKASYETRIQNLESRLQAAEAQGKNVAAQTNTAEVQTAPIESASDNAASRFNPEISLILQGQYANLNNDIIDRNITGFLSPGVSEASSGFSIAESELILSASIDPYFRGYLNAAIDPAGGIGVEEAWVETTSLGRGFTIKAGRFLSALGYQNQVHPHAWDFTTSSLMYQAEFGGAHTQNGAQVRWVAPTELFMELGAEFGNGDSFPSTPSSGVGDYTLFSHFGGDVGVSNSWLAGASYLYGKARDRESGMADLNGDPAQTLFNGNSKNWNADFVWKWAPEGNPTERYFKFVAEYFWRDEQGNLSCDVAGCTDSTYASSQSGGYLQGVYQFMPHWRVGYRYDRLNDGSTHYGANEAYLPVYDYAPTANTLMVDYSPSEFSRLRLQYTQNKSMLDRTENQLFVQYIMSLGAHGAHKY
ncbi:MAG: TonB-dependent receptor [Thiobacillus sp.]|nr:TonB-dependent receptor [Thiobacillus sp.]